MDKVKYSPYNPLSKESLGNSIMQALMSSEAVPITQLQHFTGAGIYALFYRSTSPFVQYERYAKKNRKECRFQAPCFIKDFRSMLTALRRQ